jgi:hypothetical protein
VIGSGAVSDRGPMRILADEAIVCDQTDCTRPTVF